MNINEIFYTIQGEGPNTGKPSIFIRLTGCNLRCYWCDTAYTWLFSETIAESIREKLGNRSASVKLQVFDKEKETHKKSIEEIIKEIENYSGQHVVVSGGEPLLQIEQLKKLTQILLDKHYSIEIETNGTKSPSILPEGIRFNVSPKLENSYNEKNRRYHPDILDEFVQLDTIFKFVISNKEDLQEVDQIINHHNIPNEMIFLMPEGRTSEELLEKSKWLINLCKERNYNYTHRLHVDLFEKTRGV